MSAVQKYKTVRVKDKKSGATKLINEENFDDSKHTLQRPTVKDGGPAAVQTAAGESGKGGKSSEK